MSEPVIAFDNVTAGYRGQTAIENVDLRIEPGELVGIVGPSGSGKSTLLRALTGTTDIYAGSVQLHGKPVRPGHPTRDVGFVPQLTSVEPDVPLRAEAAVLQGLAAVSRRVPWYSKAERARARDLLGRLGLAGYERSPIGQLSGGQQQRLLLARAMISDTSLVMLDEPTSGVDLQTLQDILGLLADLNAQGTTILLTTHDLNWVAAGLPRIVCINRRVMADGHPSQVMTADILEATYGAKVRIVRDGDRILVTDDRALTETGTL